MCFIDKPRTGSTGGFRAMTGSAPPRTFRSNRKGDGVLEPETARPDIGQARAVGVDRVGDAVDTLSRHARHPGRRQTKGVFHNFCLFPPFFCGMADSGIKSPRENVATNPDRPLQNNEKRFWRELLDKFSVGQLGFN